MTYPLQEDPSRRPNYSSPPTSRRNRIIQRKISRHQAFRPNRDTRRQATHPNLDIHHLGFTRSMAIRRSITCPNPVTHRFPIPIISLLPMKMVGRHSLDSSSV